MTRPRNKKHSEFGPIGRSRRCTGQRNHGEPIQPNSRQGCANDPDGSWTHQEERVERTGLAIETMTSWRDPRGPSETSVEDSRHHRGNQPGYAGARVQMLPWQDNPGPYDNTTDGTRSHYGERRGHDFAAGVQKLSWQDHSGPFENVLDRNLSQQRERIEQNRSVAEKTPLWQDHLGPSATVSNRRRPYQDNQVTQNAGAAVQPPSWEDHLWPNDNSPDENVPTQRDQRERVNSAALSLQTSPGSSDYNFTQRSPPHDKSCETEASVCLPYRKWTHHVRDQETHPTPVAPKKLLFFNPEWAPDPPAQDPTPVLTPQIVHSTTRHKTAHEAIQAHLGITKGHRREQNSQNKGKDTVHAVAEEHDRKRFKVLIPKRQCYSEWKPVTLFPGGISPLEPVASSFEYCYHGPVQRGKGIPTVCLPRNDCYGELLGCTGEIKANEAQ